MAWVHSNVGVITYTVKDDDGAQSTMTFYGTLPVLAVWTELAAETVKEKLWDRIAPLIDAALLTASFSLMSYDDAFDAPASGSDVEDKGVFLWTTDNNQKGTIALASILESKLVDSGVTAGIQIDVTDADVEDFVEAMIDGIDLNPFGILDTVHFGTSRGEDWQVLRDAYKQNRRSQKSRGYRG